MGHGKYIAPPKGQYQVQAGEVLNLAFVVLPGESKDIDVSIDFVGPGAEAHLKGLYLCKADEKVNFRIVMHHRAPGCKSTQLFNGIAGGSAQVTFNGTIVVAPDAQQTEAYQENHNIVLTPEARVETKPQLEIYADDVKCSHGATVGRLNPVEHIPDDPGLRILRRLQLVGDDGLLLRLFAGDERRQRRRQPKNTPTHSHPPP